MWGWIIDFIVCTHLDIVSSTARKHGGWCPYPWIPAGNGWEVGKAGAGTEEPSWQGSWQFHSLIEVLLHIGRDVLDGQHGLLTCGLDLRLRQQEAITTSVAQLEGVGIFHSQVVGPVVRASSSGVWGQINWGGLFRVGYAEELVQSGCVFI